MSLLGELAWVRSNVPGFPGSSLPEQLLAGRLAAESIVRKYRPEFRYDEAYSNDVLREIDVWRDRNHDALVATFANPVASALPEAIQVAFSRQKAQDFVVAMFTQAAIGLGPWMSGAVARETANLGGRFNSEWAQADAALRLNAFGAIVKMEDSGYLAQLFTSSQEALGSPIVIAGAIVLVAVGLAAVFVYYALNSKTIELNNRVFSDMCAEAQKSGDQETVRKCLEQSANLQKSALEGGPLSELVSGAVKVALVMGGLYVAGTFAMRAMDRHFTRSMATANPKTYAQAKADILNYLRSIGWSVKSDLKVPHATSPNGELRFWFKTQAVHFTRGHYHSLGEARTISYFQDIRKMTPEAFLREYESVGA